MGSCCCDGKQTEQKGMAKVRWVLASCSRLNHTEQVTSDKCGLPEECQITSGKNRSATLETQSHSFTAATFFGCSSVQKCTLLHCTIQCTVHLLLQSTLSERGEHREHLTLAHLTHTHTHIDTLRQTHLHCTSFGAHRKKRTELAEEKIASLVGVSLG